jgi:hypothetical protein
VASLSTRTGRAAALHRQAAAVTAAAATALGTSRPGPADERELHDLAERLRAAAAALVPGWLGAPLDAQSENAPLGGPLPAFVRVGTAQPLDDVRFPVVVPLLGTGHLTFDADARDARVTGLVRALLLRLLAAAPVGSLLVRAVDAAGTHSVFAPFCPLADAGLMPPPATDRAGLLGVLAEAEQWIGPERPGGGRSRPRERTMLVVVASMPELVEAADLNRIAALARHGPEAGLHLVVAGWPPPPLTAETTRPPLARSTMISMRNPHALVGDPPGASFGSPLPHLPSTGLNAPVFVDGDPPAALVDRVCRELAARSAVDDRPSLADLLPDAADGLWSEDPVEGLTVTVGHAGDRAVTLHFNDLAPHWLVGGRSGAGKSAFLTDVLFGLCTRYHPDDLAVYLVDCKPGRAYREVLPDSPDPSWLPHLRLVGMQADREYALAVLRHLAAELRSRAAGGAARFAEVRARRRLPRVLCVLEEFPVLLGGGDPVAGQAAELLDTLARTGRAYGIHLVLVTRPTVGADAPYAGRESLFGQFPVRIALPGGGEVLEPSNDAAAGLPVGAAVVNTAGGLGGPRGATRGHERLVRFPDPQADPALVASVRGRLREARQTRHDPPEVFAGYAVPRWEDEASAGGPAVALVGRTVDVPSELAAVPLDAVPGRHLVVLGPGLRGAGVVDVAARGLAVRYGPRRARFVVASLVPEGHGPAAALAAYLSGGHDVETVDGPGLVKALDGDRPGHLVVFGMDAVSADDLPSDRLLEALREAPGRGVHLLAWWRRSRRFTEAVTGQGDVAAVVLVDPPAAEMALVLGGADRWRPRPDRVWLHDPAAGRSTPVVPFAWSGGAR